MKKELNLAWKLLYETIMTTATETSGRQTIPGLVNHKQKAASKGFLLFTYWQGAKLEALSCPGGTVSEGLPASENRKAHYIYPNEDTTLKLLPYIIFLKTLIPDDPDGNSQAKAH